MGQGREVDAGGGGAGRVDAEPELL